MVRIARVIVTAYPHHIRNESDCGTIGSMPGRLPMEQRASTSQKKRMINW